MRRPRLSKGAVKQTSDAEAPVAPRTDAAKNKTSKRHPELELAIGGRIRAHRVAARMSQGALGEAVGISFQQIQKYEQGKDRVAASTLQGLARVFGVHPGVFFDEDVPIAAAPIQDVKAAFKSGDILERVHDARVRRQLLALARVLASSAETGTNAETP